MGKGERQGGRALTHPWKCCKVFFVHYNLQYNARLTNYLCIIFTIFRRLLGALHPDPHQGFTLDPTGRLSFPDPLICPPLKKILRAPMLQCSRPSEDTMILQVFESAKMYRNP